ncbi:ParA family protein [Arsenophonus nasoniae]|uniref:ParA family protein n=1 Tax=Arsenophonus nasoniae TaxID=638 RepID=A0AA95G8U3_9GAMM|nr:ParA family protein [Arsenophonus nasoniae]WGL94092.1 ParA family protein [Arsenophonus nasoniae]
MAKIISFLNGKGGVGKTTLTLNVATALGNKGLTVIAIDTDPQFSLSDFYHKRMPFDLAEAESEKEIYKVKKNFDSYDVVIIDGAGSLNSISSAAVFMSNLVIMPITPSALDFRASGTLVEAIEARNETQPNKVIARWVINKTISGAVMTSILKDGISESGIEAFKTQISQRQSYIRSLNDEGATIYDSKDAKAKGEIDLLTKEILEVLE